MLTVLDFYLDISRESYIINVRLKSLEDVL